LKHFPNSMANRVGSNHALWLNHFSGHAKIRHNVFDLKQSLYFESPIPLKSNKVVMIHNCQYADVLKIKASPGFDNERYHQHCNVISPNKSLSRAYSKNNTFISVLESGIYFVADTMRKNSAGEIGSAFYELDLNGRMLEIIEGMDSFEIQLGVLDGQQINYKSNFDELAHHEIYSIRVSARFNSIEPVNNNGELLFKKYQNEWVI